MAEGAIEPFKHSFYLICTCIPLAHTQSYTESRNTKVASQGQWILTCLRLLSSPLGDTNLGLSLPRFIELKRNLTPLRLSIG